MKLLKIAHNSIKRLKTIDAAIVALCDLASAGLIAGLIYYSLGVMLKSASFLNKLVLQKQLMLNNPSINALNISLMQQAGTTLVSGLIAMFVIFSVIYSLLNYIQWTRVAKRKFAKLQAIQFISTQTIFLLFFQTFFILSYWFVLDIKRAIFTLPIFIAGFLHLMMGSNLGLLKKGLKIDRKNIGKFVNKAFAPSFNKIYRWAIVYCVFFLILFIVMVLWGTLLKYGPIGHVISAIVCLLGFAWWRMVTYDLLSK